MAFIGQIVADRYILLEVIGRGGYSVIYRSADINTRQEYALKILHDTQHVDADLEERMNREYEALVALDGTAAPRAYRLKKEKTQLILVMELLKGHDFDVHLNEMEDGGRLITVEELVEIVEPVVDTLETAHRLGIQHRDLKPGNIFINSEGEHGGVRLLDFGLSAMGWSKPITANGMIIGSPSYIAPEVWAGNPRALDHRVDIYSMGAIVFRALAGRIPFPVGTVQEKLEMARSGKRPSLQECRPDLPEQIDVWTKTVLAIDPNERYSRIRGMWDALLAALEGEEPVERGTQYPIT